MIVARGWVLRAGFEEVGVGGVWDGSGGGRGLGGDGGGVGGGEGGCGSGCGAGVVGCDAYGWGWGFVGVCTAGADGGGGVVGDRGGSGGAAVANMAATYGANLSGVGSVAAAGAHGGMNAETVGLAATVASKVGPLMGAAQAYTTASTVMYPSPVVWANRANEHADQLINPLVWGALTPDIVALNLHYGHM